MSGSANSFYLAALPPLHKEGGDKHDMLKDSRPLGKVDIEDHELVDGNLAESEGDTASTDLYRVDHDTLSKIDKAMPDHERKRVWLADGRGVQAYVRKQADAAADTEPGELSPHSED